jgi:hypothetical protein
LIDKKIGQKGLINIERLNKTGLQILDVLLSDCKSERAVQLLNTRNKRAIQVYISVIKQYKYHVLNKTIVVNNR